MRAATGLTQSWSYLGEPDSFSDAWTVYPDHVSARLGAALTLALLIRRSRTGQGGEGSLSQAEVILDHLGVEIAQAELAAAGHRLEGGGASTLVWAMTTGVQ